MSAIKYSSLEKNGFMGDNRLLRNFRFSLQIFINNKLEKIFYVKSISQPMEVVKDNKIVYDDSETLEIEICAPEECRQFWDNWLLYKGKHTVKIAQISSNGTALSEKVVNNCYPFKRKGSKLDYSDTELYSEVYYFKFKN